MSLSDSPHLLLGRIRFLNRCIECFRKSEPVPECLCYVPREVCYKICKDSSSTSSSSSTSGASIGGSAVGKTLVAVFESPHQILHSKKTCKYNIEPKKGTCIRTTGEEYCNSQGLWVKMNKVNYSFSLLTFILHFLVHLMTANELDYFAGGSIQNLFNKSTITTLKCSIANENILTAGNVPCDCCRLIYYRGGNSRANALLVLQLTLPHTMLITWVSKKWEDTILD